MSASRFWCLAVPALLLYATPTTRAVPIRYDFSGDIHESFPGGYDRPWDKATTFSGSFVYDTDLPIDSSMAPQPGFTYYSMGPSESSGAVSSLTFKLGDLPSTTFGKPIDGGITVARLRDYQSFGIQQIYPGFGEAHLYATFGFMNFEALKRGPLTSDAPPSGLSLSDFSNGATLSLYGLDADGRPVGIAGEVTTLTHSVPEPASYLIFALVVVASAGRLRVAACPG